MELRLVPVLSPRQERHLRTCSARRSANHGVRASPGPPHDPIGPQPGVLAVYAALPTLAAWRLAASCPPGLAGRSSGETTTTGQCASRRQCRATGPSLGRLPRLGARPGCSQDQQLGVRCPVQQSPGGRLVRHFGRQPSRREVPAGVVHGRGVRLFCWRDDINRAVMGSAPVTPEAGTGWRWLIPAAEMAGLARSNWRPSLDPALARWACLPRIATRARRRSRIGPRRQGLRCRHSAPVGHGRAQHRHRDRGV